MDFVIQYSHSVVAGRSFSWRQWKEQTSWIIWWRTGFTLEGEVRPTRKMIGGELAIGRIHHISFWTGAGLKSEPADQAEIFSMKRRRKVTIHVVIRRSTVNLIKRGEIFKENVMLRRWESIACNSVITTELKRKLATVKSKRLTFQALALRQS